jgi:endonuclease/exonuclease/phosphatase family metal-dependent hydrolase
MFHTSPKSSKMRIFSYVLLFAFAFVFNETIAGQTFEPVATCDYHYEKPDAGVHRILTYNVRNGKGMDNKTDYDRVAAVINAINPEVAAIQELDSVTIRSNGVDVLKAIAEKCGMKYIYGASIPYGGGKYGIGILSKEKPINTSFFPLPGREEKRGLLMAEFKDYIFFCSHFSLTAADRVASVQLINQIAKELHKRVILAGDLNASPESEAINLLSENWINITGKQPTFPSSVPKECIDYVWGINRSDFIYNIIKQKVVPEKIASDHRPVFVDVKFN